MHYLSVLTCAGLVSGQTSSKPAPARYFITSSIRDDIMNGLDHDKVTPHSPKTIMTRKANTQNAS